MKTNANPRQLQPIRVMLVDDSPLSLELFRRMLATDPEIIVAGTARNGNDALAQLDAISPDVICTDLHMPGMDGVTLTREVMQRCPLPILVMSTSLQKNQTENIFAMLEAGAVDILAKPLGGIEMDFESMARDLIMKIKVLSGVKVIRRQTAGRIQQPGTLKQGYRRSGLPKVDPRIVCIGSSTGGPQALEAILQALPADYPLPIVCVQHIAQGFLDSMVNWLATNARIRITTARPGMRPEGGVVYFPVDDRHLEIDQDGRFRCSALPAVGGHRPSVDLAMSSIARYYWDASVGVLLTGMGQDGAQGLLEISRAGGFTIAQDEATSLVFGMPRVAIELGATRAILPLQDIAGVLIDLSGGCLP